MILWPIVAISLIPLSACLCSSLNGSLRKPQMAHFGPQTVDKEIPDSLRSDLSQLFSQLVGCEKRADWTCKADLSSGLEFTNKTKQKRIQEWKRFGTFFGKRLLIHRVESIRGFGVPGQDEQTGAFIFGCAQLRGEREGYQTFTEAVREGGKWWFIGPYTVSAIDGPPTRCRLGE